MIINLYHRSYPKNHLLLIIKFQIEMDEIRRADIKLILGRRMEHSRWPRLEISDLHRRLKTTMIYVTHDQVKAITTITWLKMLWDQGSQVILQHYLSDDIKSMPSLPSQKSD